MGVKTQQGRAMTAYRKASIRDLTTAAYELDGQFLQGIVQQDKEGGRWEVGNTSIEAWLSRYNGEEVTVIILPMSDDHLLQTKVCTTCGRTYTDVECPHCREVRMRLRGR